METISRKPGRRLRRTVAVAALGAAPLAAAITPAQAADSFVCNGTFTGGTYGDVVVPRNGVCTLIDATVSGDVDAGRNAYFESEGSHIRRGVQGTKSQTLYLHGGTTVGRNVRGSETKEVFVFDSTVEGNLVANMASRVVQVCGTTVSSGDLEVRQSRYAVLVGGSGDPDCAPNTVSTGAVKVVDNRATDYFYVNGNTVPNGDVLVARNTGPAVKEVRDNHGGTGTLKCMDNSQPFISSGNTGFAAQEGQCAMNNPT